MEHYPALPVRLFTRYLAMIYWKSSKFWAYYGGFWLPLLLLVGGLRSVFINAGTGAGNLLGIIIGSSPSASLFAWRLARDGVVWDRKRVAGNRAESPHAAIDRPRIAHWRSSDVPKLKCGSVKFYAEADELSFFRWIEGMKAVRRWWYESDCLNLHVIARPSQRDLRDLLGLFQRYKMDMRALAPLRSASTAAWFVNPKQLWHKHIFGSKSV